MMQSRTHTCGQLRIENAGERVTLVGWMENVRVVGNNFAFIVLRDFYGTTQIVVETEEIMNIVKGINKESTISVTGTVRERASKNPKQPTGDIEVVPEKIELLGRCQYNELPFEINRSRDADETQRLKYRYLDLRRPRMQDILMMRHRIAQITRSYFDEQGFLEIETPMLGRSTPEGARDYLVPSRVHPGEFYALPQSPQQFKQLLMIAGYDRYFQLARCFRDEDLRADRQPEFTQIDLEMSFVDEEDVLAVNEGFIARLLKEVKGIDLPLPLRRLPWQEAMDRFGSDKPDTRFGLELVDVTDIVRGSGFGVFNSAIAGGGSVRCICVKGGVEKFPRKKIDELAEFVKIYRAKGMAWMSLKPEGLQCSFAKFLTEAQIADVQKAAGAEQGDILFFVADAKNEVVYASLGALRVEIAKRLDLIDQTKFDVLWVTDFPLLEWDEEENRYVACHHPFTSPKDEDIALLDTDPGKARAKAYDMVINGYEAGGGSIRIHSSELQEKMFETIGFTPEQARERFGYFIDAFKYGTPPHGGLAYGLDRLVMLMTGTTNIRDVIAFPKVQTASCLMTDAPNVVEEKQLRELHICTDVEK